MAENIEFIDGELKHGAKLVRFRNPAGVEYSAIYVGNFEYASQERAKEKEMIKWFNENYKEVNTDVL